MIETFRIGMSRCLDSITTSSSAKKICRKFENQMFLSRGICTVTHEQDCSGEDSSKRS